MSRAPAFSNPIEQTRVIEPGRTPVPLGTPRGQDDGCRRYRVLHIDFDTRPYVLTIDTSGFGLAERQLWEATKDQIRLELRVAFGSDDAERKEHDFISLGTAPMSVVAYHNELLAQCRRTFIAGAYYPALVGTCALGERILNHLVLDLRASFATHSDTKRIARAKSVQNWSLAIQVLAAWGVLATATALSYTQLERMRHSAVHYVPTLHSNWRERALDAITLLQRIVDEQFGVSEMCRWLFQASGATFVRRDWEDRPFVRAFYLPNCALLSPHHVMEWQVDNFIAIENRRDCQGLDLSDRQFEAAMAEARLPKLDEAQD